LDCALQELWVVNEEEASADGNDDETGQPPLVKKRKKDTGEMLVVNKYQLAGASRVFLKQFFGEFEIPNRFQLVDNRLDALKSMFIMLDPFRADDAETMAVKPNRENVIDLLAVSQKYLVPAVHKKCINFLIGLPGDDALLKLKIADQFKLASVEGVAIEEFGILAINDIAFVNKSPENLALFTSLSDQIKIKLSEEILNPTKQYHGVLLLEIEDFATDFALENLAIETIETQQIGGFGWKLHAVPSNGQNGDHEEEEEDANGGGEEEKDDSHESSPLPSPPRQKKILACNLLFSADQNPDPPCPPGLNNIYKVSVKYTVKSFKSSSDGRHGHQADMCRVVPPFSTNSVQEIIDHDFDWDGLDLEHGAPLMQTLLDPANGWMNERGSVCVQADICVSVKKRKAQTD